MPGEETVVLMSAYLVNKLIELAIKQYDETGKVPTYEELEQKNLLTGLKIDRLMKE